VPAKASPPHFAASAQRRMATRILLLSCCPCVITHTYMSAKKTLRKIAYKPAFFSANLRFATETSLSLGAKPLPPTFPCCRPEPRSLRSVEVHREHSAKGGRCEMDERSQLRSIDAGGNSSEARPRFAFNWDGSRYTFHRRNIFFTLSNTLATYISRRNSDPLKFKKTT
jgi:hypothetical protein